MMGGDPRFGGMNGEVLGLQGKWYSFPSNRALGDSAFLKLSAMRQVACLVWMDMAVVMADLAVTTAVLAMGEPMGAPMGEWEAWALIPVTEVKVT
jgi:hypothetical protein